MSREVGKHVAVLQDLCGPKMRHGAIPGDLVECPLVSRGESGDGLTFNLSLTRWLAINTERLMAHVLASVATYEMEVKTERQRAGIETARVENGGRCPWRGRKPGTRVKVTEEVERVIRERSAAGDSIASIASVCGLLSRVTVYAVLNRVQALASTSGK
jgi:hypothetical protein